MFMDETAAPFPADRFATAFDGMREAVAAEGTRKGLAGALQAAILRLLEAILALLVELRAGTLAAVAVSEAAPGAAEPRSACADRAGDREPRRPLAPSPDGRSGDGGADSGGPPGARCAAAVCDAGCEAAGVCAGAAAGT